jgi:hypothetical protein
MVCVYVCVHMCEVSIGWVVHWMYIEWVDCASIDFVYVVLEERYDNA